MTGRRSPQGWNGATLTAFGETVTLTDAYSGIYFFGASPPPFPPPGAPADSPPPPPPIQPGGLAHVSVTSGAYPTEVSWSVACVDGTTLAGGAPFGGSMS
eukprot:3007300-Prymnesium_polylepis.1